jgi:hypothetical protein
LPFEGLFFQLAFLPDFRRAAPLDDEHGLLVEVTLDIERPAGRYFDNIKAPEGFDAEKLDIGALAAEALPGLHRQVLHLMHADAAIDRHAFVFHEPVIGALGSSELADAGVLARLGFVPMGPRSVVMHGRPRNVGARGRAY